MPPRKRASGSQSILLIFIHGWSVTSKDTYGELPEALAQRAGGYGLNLDIRHIYLGRYISFHDEVTLDDVARAMEHALRTDIPDNEDGRRAFSCVTHSTGGPLVRLWVDTFYGAGALGKCPLRHLVMLAPANHGSALAILGKGRLGRIQAWYGGVEPGQGVLNWLCLGSDGAWALQQSYLGYGREGTKFYPFVLSGETIDAKFYDFLNSYLVEKGSDGVVRLAAANLNYAYIKLRQSNATWGNGGQATRLDVMNDELRPGESAFAVIPNASHSGARIGIMRSVTRENAAKKPVVDIILKCLQVKSKGDYQKACRELASFTEETQQYNAREIYDGTVRRFIMFVFRVRDEEGRVIDDYDMVLLGDGFQPGTLPKGFMIDRHKNATSQSLVYYMDYDVLMKTKNIGIRITARPSFGVPGKTPVSFAGYLPTEFRSDGIELGKYIRPNETVYVDVELMRMVDKETLRLDPLREGKGSFKRTKPGGGIPPG